MWEAFCCSSLEPWYSSSAASVLTVYKKTMGQLRSSESDATTKVSLRRFVDLINFAGRFDAGLVGERMTWGCIHLKGSLVLHHGAHQSNV